MTRSCSALVLGALLGVATGCNFEGFGAPACGAPQSQSGECPAGYGVLLSDYSSTQIALADREGETECGSLIHSGSTPTSGLSFTLSGDVVLPSTAPVSGRVVLVDRFGTNVLSFIDPESSEVEGQLAVGTGFESNPYDYLEVEDDRAFVTRFGHNPDPGATSFDGGSDVLVVRPRSLEIVGSIPMPYEDDLPPRPGGMTRIGADVIVSLGRISRDFKTTGESLLVGVSIAEEAPSFRVPLPGLKGCGRPVPSPSGARLALACSGNLNPNGDVDRLAESALVIFDAAARPPVELERFPAEQLAGEPIQSDVAFADELRVLFKTQTGLRGAANNRWLWLDLATRVASELLEARPSASGRGRGLVYGGMSCLPGCSDVCLMADADRGVLQRARIESDGSLRLLAPVRVEDRVGLPPRDVVAR